MPAKIEACPFNREIRCRKSALVRRLTRSILSRDSPPRRDSPHWIEIMIDGKKRRFFLSNDCLDCYYRPKPVEEKTEITLDKATVEGYRTLSEASKKVHEEEPEENEDYGDIPSMNSVLLDTLSFDVVANVLELIEDVEEKLVK